MIKSSLSAQRFLVMQLLDPDLVSSSIDSKSQYLRQPAESNHEVPYPSLQQAIKMVLPDENPEVTRSRSNDLFSPLAAWSKPDILLHGADALYNSLVSTPGSFAEGIKLCSSSVY
jgi:hypothetical protein